MLSVAINNLRGKTLDLLHRPSAGAVVLLYHRVTDLNSDPQLLSVSPERFDEHMRLISQAYQPITLQQLASCIRRGDVPAHSVVVTFDDGYADNLTHARPILEKYQVPATVFVATGNIDQPRGFYWDKLEDIFLTGRDLPERLSINLNGETYSGLSQADRASRADANWDALSPAQTPRQAMYLSLCDKLRPMSADDQQSAINELCAWANICTDARPTHRVMTSSQLRDLSDSSLIEIGAHTVDHTLLATQPGSEQLGQINDSKTTLEAIIDKPVDSFSYPYGTRSSYTADTAALVADAGFTCACSNFPGVANRSSDPYQIPRVLVRNWAGERMLKELKGACA